MAYTVAAMAFALFILYDCNDVQWKRKPLRLKDEIDIEYLPPVKEAAAMSFKERNVRGFKLGMKKGIEYFFGLGSVTYYISQSVRALDQGSADSKLKKLKSCSPEMLLRYLRGKQACKKEKRELLPKDLFRLKGFMCAGTDNWCYKDDLEHMWGIRPMEIFAGTEPTCIGTETWSRNGMYFFPDACFYEFIPESEMLRSRDDPDYQPRTVLMDQVAAGEKYELVITVLKGGAFVRYRVGDVYRCMGVENQEEQIRIPRFSYIDRVPDVIDIAGFTRITENSIRHSIALSGLPVKDWFARKEYTENKRPQLHLYVEMERMALPGTAVSVEILRQQLGIYFKYLDSDYQDLQKILGVDPLNITLVRCGTFAAYAQSHPKPIRKMNPGTMEVADFLKMT